MLPEQSLTAAGGVRESWVAMPEQAGTSACPPRDRDRGADDPRVGMRAALIRHALLVAEVHQPRQGVRAAPHVAIGDLRDPLPVRGGRPQRAGEHGGRHGVPGGPDPCGGTGPADDGLPTPRPPEAEVPVMGDREPVAAAEAALHPPGAVEAPQTAVLPLQHLDRGWPWAAAGAWCQRQKPFRNTPATVAKGGGSRVTYGWAFRADRYGRRSQKQAAP